MGAQGVSYLPFIVLVLVAVAIGALIGFLDLRTSRGRTEEKAAEEKPAARETRAA